MAPPALSRVVPTKPTLSGDWGGQLSGAHPKSARATPSTHQFVGAKERIREISQMAESAVRILLRTTADATTQLMCRARLLDPREFEELAISASGYPRGLGDERTLADRVEDAFTEWTNPSDVAVALKSTRRNVLQALSSRHANGLITVERRLTATGEKEYRAVRKVKPEKAVRPLSKSTRGLAVAGALFLALALSAGRVWAQDVPSVWNSWEVVTQAGSPQGQVTSSIGITATIEFYESTNDRGVVKGAVLPNFYERPHPSSNTLLAQYWGPVPNLGGYGPGDVYPYAGKSLVTRGAGAGETNTPMPLGVSDLQLQPPNNDHLLVAAFRVPVAGTYTIAGLAVRRVEEFGNAVVFRVFTAQQLEIVSLTATPTRAWVTSPTTYTLPDLTVGSYLYFAVDRAGEYIRDATEIAWTVSAYGPGVVAPTPPPSCTLSASETHLSPGQVTRLSWTSVDATSVSVNQGVGVVLPPGAGESIPLSPPIGTTVYTATATGLGGSATCTATVTMLDPVDVPPDTYGPVTGYLVTALQNGVAVGMPLTTTLIEWLCDQPLPPIETATVVNPRQLGVGDPDRDGRACTLTIVAWRRTLPVGEYSVWIAPLNGTTAGPSSVAIPAISVQLEVGRPLATPLAYFPTVE